MRAKSLLVRSSAIIIPCAHVLIVISLFFPFAPYQESVSTGWQWFLRPSGPGHLDLYSIASYDMLIVALALPPLASVVVFRSPTRMTGLLGVWISLPLTLFYSYVCVHSATDFHPVVCIPLHVDYLFYVCANSAIDFHRLLIGVSSAIWFPPVGFALSFISCLALALYLPFLRTGAQERRAMRRPAHLEAGQHEGAERVSHPDGGEPPAYVTRLNLRPHPAFIGLLCHLLIGLSLLFYYTEFHGWTEPAMYAAYLRTGWQLLGDALQSQSIVSVVALLLLVAVVLPALLYLACLLPLPRQREQRDALLVTGTYLSYLLNTMGFSLSLTALALSLFVWSGDLHDVLSTDVAFAIPPTAFLLSLQCSTILLDSRLRQREAREWRS